jgi:uncharacterized protein
VSWYRRRPDGTLVVAIHAQPGARRTEVAGVHGQALRIRIAAPPVEGRANEALVEFLARLFEVARRDVVLVAGETSRQKRFEIRASHVDPASIAG